MWLRPIRAIPSRSNGQSMSFIVGPFRAHSIGHGRVVPPGQGRQSQSFLNGVSGWISRGDDILAISSLGFVSGQIERKSHYGSDRGPGVACAAQRVILYVFVVIGGGSYSGTQLSPVPLSCIEQSREATRSASATFSMAHTPCGAFQNPHRERLA